MPCPPSRTPDDDRDFAKLTIARLGIAAGWSRFGLEAAARSAGGRIAAWIGRRFYPASDSCCSPIRAGLMTGRTRSMTRRATMIGGARGPGTASTRHAAAHGDRPLVPAIMCGASPRRISASTTDPGDLISRKEGHGAKRSAEFDPRIPAECSDSRRLSSTEPSPVRRGRAPALAEWCETPRR